MDITKKVDAFNSYNELMTWARQNGQEDNECVTFRAINLICQGTQTSEEPSHSLSPTPTEQLLPLSSDTMDAMMQDLGYTSQDRVEMSILYNIDREECPSLQIIDPTIQSIDQEDDDMEISKTDKRQKGLPCRFCGDTFRRMPDLRKHRMTCRNRPLEPKPSQPLSFDKTPPKRQRTIDQYGGIGSPADPQDVEDVPPVELPYTIRKKGSKTFAKTGAVDTTYEIKFNDQWNGDKLKTLHGDLESMFEDVFRQTVEDIHEGDLGRVVIHHQDLDGAIVVPLQPLTHLNAETIMGHIEKVLTSHEDLLLNTSFHVQIGIIRVPRGGRSNKTLTQLTGSNNSIHLKKSLVQIINRDDDLCMSRAIAVSWCKAIKVTRDEWRNLVSGAPKKTSLLDLVLQHKKCPKTFYKNVCKKSRKEQKKLALKLCELAGIPTDRPSSLNDIPAFERVLKCQILVVSAEMGNKFLRVGDQESDRPKLFLYLVEDPQPHFHAIVSITGFFSSSYFCHQCLKPYNNKLRHSCSTTCIVCHSQKCPETDNQVTCLHCHVTCRSPECFQRHKTGRTNKKNGSYTPSKCECYWKCTVCKKVLCRQERDPQLHQCEEWKCPCCNEFVDKDHLCYQPPKDVEDTKTKFIFYDFECRQDEQMECEDGYVPAGNCSTCHEDNCPHQTKCQNCQQSWCGKSQHIPNYLVAQSACDVCKNQPVTEESKCINCGSRCSVCNKRDKKTKEFMTPPCEDTCGYHQVIFEGDGSHIEFSRWLFNDSHKDVTAIAHNNKAYDGYFVLEYMINQSMYPNKIIYNGSKIMYMQLEKGLNIRIIDSLNFLPMKLAALPKAFGLTELKKGYFPHFFNTKENQNYCGPFPNPTMYGADYMGSKERVEFMTWHAQQVEQFDFRKEMKAYCVSDVTVLREACLKFQQLMMEATSDGQIDGDLKQMTGGVDPFAESITIASLCMRIFQSKFLKKHDHVKLTDGQTITDWATSKLTEDGSRHVKKTNGQWIPEFELRDRAVSIHEAETVPSPIAQIPSQGYVRRDQYSKASIEWIMWIQHQNPNYELQHALNGGEYLVPGTHYRLDGYCPKTNTAFEYQGCVWHACKTCFPHDRSNTILPRTKQSLEELYALTCKKRQVLKSKGYKVVEIWEHEFNQQLKTNPEMKVFVDSLDLQERLEPRDSFFGGRTNASTLHYKVNEDEQIHYSDFTSLYPWVNKYCEYPVGHPQIIYKDFKPLEQYFGIAKVKVVPPRRLYHPVLPYRSNGKLKFPLCRTCADKEQQTPCKHTRDARSMVGTWCTPEILKAKEKGYTLLKIYEVYHWAETSQYDPETDESGLFTDYINTFLKLKQQASGWPDWCESEDAKSRYIQQYEEKEGIQLDKDKIKKNPGLRSLAKLCLNSFWGKFGQRLNMQQSDFIHESNAETFFQMLTDPAKEVTNFHILTDRILQLEYNHKSAFVPEDFKTNIFLATFTTTWARLKLYSVLEKLDQQVLYYDTDSVIYVARPGSYQPPLGDYLGELTNELDSNDHIVEFISAGPKNYSYRTVKGQEVCKVRGFSLNFANSQLINFEAIRDIVLSPQRDGTITVTNPSKISREKRKRKIYNREEKKSYQMVYTKRVIQPNLDTLPFGF